MFIKCSAVRRPSSAVRRPSAFYLHSFFCYTAYDMKCHYIATLKRRFLLVMGDTTLDSRAFDSK
jgi:hypothetical protein